MHDYEIDREMMADFIDESMDGFAEIPGLFMALETNPSDLASVEAIFRPVHSLKGNAAYFGLIGVKNLAHDLESLLDMIRKSKLAPTKHIIDCLLAGTDEIVTILDKTRTQGEEVLDQDRYDRVRKDVQAILNQDDHQQPETPLTQMEKWREFGKRLTSLNDDPDLKTLSCAGDLERLMELAIALAPPEAGLSLVTESHDLTPGNPIQELLHLLNAPVDSLATSENLGEIRRLMGDAEAKAKEENTRKVIGEAREELELFVSTVGYDQMLHESLVELCQSLIDIQSWADETSKTPLKDLRNHLSNPPKEMAASAQAEITLGLLKALDELAESEASHAILEKALEEFGLFMERIGYDAMLRELMDEYLAELEPLQSWRIGDKEEETDDTSAEESVSGEMEARQPETEVVKSDPVPVAAEVTQSPKRTEPSRTMRVSEESIDAFLGYVGELIAVDEMFRYIHSEMVREEIDLSMTSSLLRVINTFTKLSDDLQKSIMEIRKVSMKPMLQKTQRIVRDVAHANGKEIETLMKGEDTMIDRSLIDTLEAPMVHMVRNAADHGIDTPQARIDAGKEPTGLITVAVKETEDEIILSISDDGRGLNYERIREKAERLGLLEQGENATQDRLAEMIFSSGFSTAEQVTDVSGRGVGMDAVKRAVEDAGGSIKITSETGEGSTFSIQLPKTVGTQIINSFVVRIGEERFVLPMDRISGSFKPEAQHFHALPNGAICVKRNEVILPVYTLRGVFKEDPDLLADGILITIESRIRPFAFYVDTILGMQKVVLRGVPWMKMCKFLGAAIMGDGKVSMIINLAALEESTSQPEAQRV